MLLPNIKARPTYYTIVRPIGYVGPTYNTHRPSQCCLQMDSAKFSDYEFYGIDDQITKFLKSGIIERATHCNGEFVSNIFARDKKDGSLRVILNLIDLNQFITYHHFKMDTIDTVINLENQLLYGFY